MKSFLRNVSVVIYIATVLWVAQEVSATKPLPPGEFLSVKGEVIPGQLVRFEFESHFARQCQGTVSAQVVISNYTRELSVQDLQLLPLGGKRSDSRFLASFEEIIPPNDTTKIEITVRCDALTKTTVRYLVTTEEVFPLKGTDPRSLPKKPKTYRTKGGTKHSRDTLTVAQLSKTWTIILDLRKPEDFDMAKEILGAIPDSCEVEKAPGHYMMKMTFDLALKLGENRIKGNQPKWERDLWQQREADSIKQLDQHDDGEKEEPEKPDVSSDPMWFGRVAHSLLWVHEIHAHLLHVIH